MNRDDLMATLGLDDALEPASAGPGAMEIEGDLAPAPPPPSPYCFEHDDHGWTRRKGAELVAPGDPEAGVDPGVLAKSGVAAEAAADFFAAAFEPELTLTGRCDDAIRHEFLDNLIQTDAYRSLVADTHLNPITAEMASMHFASGYCELVKQRAEDQAEGDGTGDTPRDRMRRGLQAARAAASAAGAAKKDVGEFNDAMEAAGLGPGDNNGKMDPRRAAEMFRRVRSNPTLRKIFEAAGVFRRLAQSRRRRRAIHGADETVGVTLGGDLGRLIPGEVAALAGIDEYLELDALRRFAERQSLQYDLTATEAVGRGPVVVVVDESGSMSGRPIEQAKGLALAMAWVARQQKRWVALIGFSGGSDGTLCVLPPGRWDEAALMGWLEHFYSGGTTLDVPIKELPFAMWPKLIEAGATRGKTDILIITDAQVNAPEDQVVAFNRWRKAENARVSSLIIGCDPGDLRRVSDECHTIRGLDADDESVAQTLDF